MVVWDGMQQSWFKRRAKAEEVIERESLPVTMTFRNCLSPPQVTISRKLNPFMINEYSLSFIIFFLINANTSDQKTFIKQTSNARRLN